MSIMQDVGKIITEKIFIIHLSLMFTQPKLADTFIKRRLQDRMKELDGRIENEETRTGTERKG